jgi:hypothetical protein
MPLSKILFKPGINRENTRYTTEGGWYDGDKVRFRQGNPEKIGGWQRISANTFLGVCRSLWNWVTLSFLNLLGIGTNLKFYIENGGAYYDITPIRATVTLTNPFTATLGSSVITVTDTAHGCGTGDFVTFSGATGLGGNITAAVLNAEYQVSVTNDNVYTITVGAVANATDVSGSPGGGTVTAAYQLNVGTEAAVPTVGWGGGAWGSGSWGVGSPTAFPLRLWSQRNYGEDLVFGPRGGGIYYWDATAGVTSRGVLLSSLGGTCTITIASPAVVTSTVLYTEGAAVAFSTTGALPTGITAGTTYFAFNNTGLTFQLIDAAGNIVNTSGTQSGTQSITPQDIPLVQNYIMVSDTSRFIFAMGTNEYGTAVLDPMLIRWSNQDDFYNWTPDATNQAGSIRLSYGSEIVTAIQTRQEIVVFTDSAVYSLQYLGPPSVWQTQLLGDNVSIASPSCVTLASGILYWMGVDKFYAYDGRVQTLNCDVRRYLFSDFNSAQSAQVFSGTNEGFNEVWWFYCSATGPNGTNTPENPNSVVDRYVVYNYLEKIWYYGTLQRTAWLDSGLRDYPLAATYSNNIVDHELGLNDNQTATTLPIAANISSSEFDIQDGHNFGFVWRVLPDLTFGESSASPTAQPATVTMTLYGLSNSGSGSTSSAGAPVASVATYALTEEFTGQIYTRMRGRQLIFKIESNQVNTEWQIGAPRIDIRPDGRR